MHFPEAAEVEEAVSTVVNASVLGSELPFELPLQLHPQSAKKSEMKRRIAGQETPIGKRRSPGFVFW
jgi:hypothetical protein